LLHRNVVIQVVNTSPAPCAPSPYPCQIRSHRFSIFSLHRASCFSFHGLPTVGTFARAGISRLFAMPLRLTVPITRDAAFSCPLFTLDKILGTSIAANSPRAPCSSLAWLLPAVMQLDAVLDPGRRLRTRLYRTAALACAAPQERIGTLQYPMILGATFQIQGYTLHLVLSLSSFPASASVLHYWAVD